MEEKSLKKCIFVGNVFEDIPKEDEIEPLLERQILAENIVAADSADFAQIMSEAVFVEIKSRYLTPISLFDLPLENAVTATGFREFPCIGYQIAA